MRNFHSNMVCFPLLNWITVNGKDTYAPPTPDAPKNKMGFFLADPFIGDAIDVIEIYRARVNQTTQYETHERILARNIRPFEWKYIDYELPHDGEGNPDELQFCKSGTREPAFGDADFGFYSQSKMMFTLLKTRRLSTLSTPQSVVEVFWPVT